jgi:hypothetical protein
MQMSEQTKDPKTTESPEKEVPAPAMAVQMSSADRRRSIIEAAEKRRLALETADLATRVGDGKETNTTKTVKRKKSYALRGYYRN